MTGAEFIRRIRRLGRRRGIRAFFDETRGKGSHGTLVFGDRFTVVKDRKKELSKGLLKAMCDQLGIRLQDL